MSTTMPAVPTPIVVNIHGPSSLYDSISVGGAAAIWPVGTTAVFSLRPLTSRTAVIAGNTAVVLTPPDLNGNNVRYDWSGSDMTTAGEGNFFGWWGYTVPGGSLQETREFPIWITDHGPGTATETGAIVDGASRHLPVTFNALRNDARFGDRRMQELSNLIQLKVLGAAVTPDGEAQYPELLIDYLSKRLALDLITPGIDFWSRQIRTSSSTQVAEMTSYPDMIAGLKELKASLARQLCHDWETVQLFLPSTPNYKVIPMPTSSLLGIPHKTRSPQHMPRLQTGLVGWNDEDLGFFPFA
jgi:hypothetical protein